MKLISALSIVTVVLSRTIAARRAGNYGEELYDVYDENYDKGSRHVIYTNEFWDLEGFYDYHITGNTEACPDFVNATEATIKKEPVYEKCVLEMKDNIQKNNVKCSINFLVGRTMRLQCTAYSNILALGKENLAISGIARVTDTDSINWTPGKNNNKKNGKKKKPKQSNSGNPNKAYCKTKQKKSTFDPIKPILWNPTAEPNCTNTSVPEWPQTELNQCLGLNNCQPGAECPQDPPNVASCLWENQVLRSAGKYYQPKNQCTGPCAIGNRGNAVPIFIVDTGCDVDIQALSATNFTCGAGPNNTTIPIPDRVRLSIEAGNDQFFNLSVAANLMPAQDKNGHGTFVASRAAGQGITTADESDVICVKAFGLRGQSLYGIDTSNVKTRNDEALTASLIQGIDDTISILFSIIEQAKGQFGNKGPIVKPVLLLPWNAPKNYLIDRLIRMAQNKFDFTIVMAAGNDKLDAGLFSPASSKVGTVVGATSQCGKLLGPSIGKYKGSNFGKSVDFNLPGFLLGGQTILRDPNGKPIPASEVFKMYQEDRSDIIKNNPCGSTQEAKLKMLDEEYYNTYYSDSLQLRSGTGYAAATLAGIFAAYTSKCAFVPRQEEPLIPPNQCRCEIEGGLSDELRYITYADNVKTHTSGASCYVSQKAAVDILLNKASQNEKCLASSVGVEDGGDVTTFDLFLLAFAIGQPNL